jgi:hypothetical protein
MQEAHPLNELLIRLRPRTGRSTVPGIEPASTHPQHSAQWGQPKLPSSGLDEGVLHCDALAKYAAAFFKISRSSVTRVSSRFKRAISVVRSFRAPDPGNAPAPRVWNSRCHL